MDVFRRIVRALIVLGAYCAFVWQSGDAFAQVDRQIVQFVTARLAERPNDASCWRMMAKIHRQQQDDAAAREALAHALALDPDSAAAHFDVATLLLDQGDSSGAQEWFEAVIALAPGSYHADAAERHLARLADGANDSPLRLVNFEPSWMEHPNDTDDVVERLPLFPWHARIELGTLYNSNVALAPISRQLSADEQDAWQVFAKGQFAYCWLEANDRRWGLLLDNYFTFNEGVATDFDVQHMQPGIYVESPPPWLGRDWAGRLEYSYSYDAFGGQTLGTRHGINGSLSHLPDDCPGTTFYWSSNFTNFNNDGANPAIDSLDGWTHSLGLLRTWTFLWENITVLQAGADFQWADLQGDDQTYRGVMTFLSADTFLNECLVLRPEVGLGYRTYPDFTQTPARDELILRGGGQVRRWIGQYCFVAGSFYYDSFVTDNNAFAADRFTAGASVGFEH